MPENKKKLIFISESIRRDAHAPLRYFSHYRVLHFYLKAPYGDLDKSDLAGARQVPLNRLFGEIVKEKPDIIQGVEPFGSKLSLRLAYLCLKATRATGAKLVVPVLENRPVAERFNPIQRAALKLFNTKYFRACDIVVALNRGAVRNIKYYCPEAKIKTGIIWGVWGVDLEMFKPSKSKNLNEIVYVGRLIEDKGLKYLLEGFEKARQIVPGLRLKIVGGGNFRDYLENYAKDNGFAASVEFTGVVKNKDVPEILAKAALCVYPSVTMKRWEEQVGTVNFQALSCGTPILTTKSGAIPEYIKEGEGAMLVEEKSAKAIAQAIITFFTNHALQNKLTEGAREAAKKYDIRAEVKKAQELLDGLF